MHKHSYLALSGGVGGAKLALGLQTQLRAGELRVIVNTGDDFEHMGLPISPDIDTLIYTLAGCANPATGWGMRDESWQFMARLRELGGETWFQLGDRDLAMHVRRRDLLSQNLSLSQVTDSMRQALGIPTAVLPMTDGAAPTLIHTADGELAFQDYFVRQQAAPVVTNITYGRAAPAAAALEALADAGLQAIIVTPSNPWLSIAPILSLQTIKSTILKSNVPVIGVSPIIGGQAVKGPTAKIMRELGIEPSSVAIAKYYAGLLDGLLIDTQDADQQSEIEALGIEVRVSDTLMNTLDDKARVAGQALQFAMQLSARNERG